MTRGAQIIYLVNNRWEILVYSINYKYCCLYYKMFGRALRFMRRCKPLLATSVVALTYGLHRISFDDSAQKIEKPPLPQSLKNRKMLKKMIEVDVCESKRIKEGQLFFFDITDQPEDNTPPKTYKVAIGRVKGKLYAVLGHCTYREPLSGETLQSVSFQDAMIFNQKLMCPHHGCAFDIRTGSIEYGPARENLPRFYVQQIQNKVRLAHPAVIPVSVTPKYQFRDMNDLRKVVVLGGDHNATMGIIDGFKKYDFGGEFSIIVNDGQYEYPHRQDLLHRNLLNLNKNPLTWSYFNKSAIDKELDQKIYSKLDFYPQIWYQGYGIDFIFNPEKYRIINKRFYPYVKFMEGTKVQFDGLIFATGFLPKFPNIPSITTEQVPEDATKLNLPVNVFAPFCNKKQHRRLNRYLNCHKIKKMLVLGMNVQSLQFIETMNKEFPDVTIKVIDVNKENTMTEIYGPDIGKQIIKQYTKRGVQFFVKMEEIPQFTNRLNFNLAIEESDNGVGGVRDSITAKLDENLTLVGDCMVLFPNNHLAHTEPIKNAKFVDIDYNKKNERIIVDTHNRTDTKRMFAAGSCASQDFFFTRDKLQVINPNAAHEQGMTAAFNANALNIPYHYIPFETHNFYGKKILYAGGRKIFNEMFVMGDVDKWDFIAFYGNEDDIIAVSASPSRQKEFQVIREAFRLQCQPSLPDVVRGLWKIPQVYLLIRKLNKSGCYKDLIQSLHPEMNIPDVIWMDRENGSYVTNEQEDDDERNVEVDERGYTTENF